MAEEASDAPSDTGSEPELLKTEFPDIDFDNVQHGWWVHEGDYAFEPKSLIRRAAKLRRWIKNRPEKEVVLVAHGFFNHYITGDVDEQGEQTTPWWNEAELRTYKFEDGAKAGVAAYVGGGNMVDGKDAAILVETEESLERLRQRRQSVVRNVNRPAERRKSLVEFQADREIG